MSDLATNAGFPDILRVDARAAFAVGGLTAGTLFAGRYRIVRLVASGGMSAVYEVVDERTERRRALKVLLATLLGDPEAKRRFELEARITASVESPHVAEVLDSGVDDALGVPYLVTALLEGSDLGAVLRTKGTLGAGEVLAIVAQAAKGLEATHARAIVHRDLKPENLFLCRSGDGSDRVVIVDFGVAKSLERTGGSATRSILGTPLYVAPEQIQFKREEITLAADLYALGMVVYTLLVGEPYFAPEEEASDGTMQFFLDVVGGLREPAVARARRRRDVELPAAFDAWFARAVAVAPRDRFADARALEEGLRAVFAGTETAKDVTLPVAKTLVDGAFALPTTAPTPTHGSRTPTLTSARTVSSALSRPGLRVGLGALTTLALLALAASWWGTGAADDERAAIVSREPATARAAVAPDVTAAPTPPPVTSMTADTPIAEASVAAATPSATAPSAAAATRVAKTTAPVASTSRPPAPTPSAAPTAPRYVPPLIER